MINTRAILKGKQVYLNRVKIEDLNFFKVCNNDLVYSRYLGTSFHKPANETQLEEQINNMNKSNNEIVFAIRLLEDDQMIGVLGFGEIEWTNQVSEMWVGIHTQNQSKGLGTEALELALDYGFNELNLHRIQLTVLGYNKRAIGLYEKLGFIKEGTYREFGKRDGKRYDMFLYSMLEHEYRALKK